MDCSGNGPPLPVADPGVEPGVGDVHHEVYEDQRHRYDQHHALDDRVVEGADGVHHPQPDPGHDEDRLQDDVAADDGPQEQPDYRQHRYQRVLQGVAQDDHSLAESLGPGGAHVVLSHHLQHLG